MNPHFAYCLSFLIALLAYGLGWSNLYPKLEIAVIAFLGATIALHFIMGWRWRKNSAFAYARVASQKLMLHSGITIFVYVLWTFDFLWEGGIPLIKILLNQPYDYRLFGAPSIHVFTVTFASFYTVYLFHEYLSHRQKTILLLYFINLAAAILIYSRAMFVFNLIASVFLLIMSMKTISFRFVVSSAFGLLLLGYGFGVLGTLRVSREAESPYDNTLFLKIGDAAPSFRNSMVPDEYFWGYMFMTSPLANFQYNINHAAENSFTINRFAGMVNNEILMDFISKRINALTGSARENDRTIFPSFNVSTVYSRSFNYVGWSGIIFMAIIVLAIPWLYLKLLPTSSPFFMTGVAILSTMFLFLAYDNTIRFTGLALQLAYPVLFTIAIKHSSFFRKKQSQLSSL